MTTKLYSCLFDNGAGGGSSDVTGGGGGGGGSSAAAAEPSGTLTEGNDDPDLSGDGGDDDGLDVKDKDKKKSKKYPEITTTDDDDLSSDDKDKTSTVTPSKDPNVGEDDTQVSNRRNYGEFKDTDVPYLKKLPNGIFNHVAPLFKKLYEQESKVKSYEDAKAGVIPESWYDSEDAYTLSTEYRKVVQGYQSAAFEISHWEQQLMKIEAGQPWQNISL